MNCPKCGSDNINFQREQSGSIGGSSHKLKDGKRGCLYFFTIGWFFTMLKWMLIICTAGIALLFLPKKNSGKVQGVSANMNFNRTMAICQDCGNTWKVK